MNMKKTTLATAILLSLALTGCGSSDSGSSSGGTDTGGDDTANLYAAITDTVGSDTVAEGESTTSGFLKYDIVANNGAELTEGAFSVDVLYPSDQDQDFSIGLFNSDNSTSGQVADIILKSDGRIQTRVAGSGTTVDGVTHTPGETNTFVVTWDAATAQYTAMIGDTEIFTGDFNNDTATGVAYFGFKLGSNDKVAAGTSTVDNIFLYSDEAMTTAVFEDDFEDFVVDEQLDGDGDVYSGNEAIVAGEASDDDDDEVEVEGEFVSVTDDFDSYTADLQIDSASDLYTTKNAGIDGNLATVSALEAISGNSLYVYDGANDSKPYVNRAFDNGAATAGSVSLSVYIPDDEFNTKASYLHLGSAKDGSSSNRFSELLFEASGAIVLRTSTDKLTIATVDIGQWNDIAIAWDETDITVTVNDVEYTDSTYIAENANGYPAFATFYAGDNGNTGSFAYFDDLELSLFVPAE